MKRGLTIILCAALFCPALVAFIGCTRADPAARCEYAIDAEYREGVLSAEMDFCYKNQTGVEISQLKFNLFGNAYREDSAYSPVSSVFSASAYYGGKSYGGMEILSVSPCASWEIGGADENILVVDLAESVPQGGQAEITVEYRLTLARVNHRTGIAEHAVNLGNFYPVLCVYEKNRGFYECEYYSDGDPFYSECADYDVTLRVASDYTAAMSGEILSAESDGGVTEYRAELINARDFAIVLSKEFSLVQGEADGVRVMYYYYDDDRANERLELIENSLAYFSDTFGEYLYDTYSAVQTGFCVGGMEYPALTMIGDHISGVDYDYTIVHETAHQWWYAAVGNNQLENAWMDEGLAEYSTLLFFDRFKEYGLTRSGLMQSAENAYKAFYSVHSQIFGQADTAMNKKLGEYLSEYHYVTLTYDKGMILFDTLRRSVGDKKFFSGLEHYYAAYSGKVATPRQLSSSFKKAGVDVSGLFDSFIEGKAVI